MDGPLLESGQSAVESRILSRIGRVNCGRSAGRIRNLSRDVVVSGGLP